MMRVGPLLFGADAAVTDFVGRRDPYPVDGDYGKCTTIGVIRDEQLIGGVVYFDWRPNIPSVHVAYAFDSPRWATPHVLRAVCRYPFEQLGCVRVTCIVGRRNKRSRRFVERGIGFKLEGLVRKGFGIDDACIYGLLKHECRWLKNEQTETNSPAAAA